MLIEAYINSLLPLEMQEQDEGWFEDIDYKMISFNNKIHNWLRNGEHEKKKNDCHRNQEVQLLSISQQKVIIKFILQQIIKRQESCTRRSEND